MENEEKARDGSEERELSAGDKFLKELKEMPYTNDRVGQAFVILHKGLRLPDKKKDNPTCENSDARD